MQSREPTKSTTFDPGSGNRTRATLVGGECSHHCAIPALPTELYLFEYMYFYSTRARLSALNTTVYTKVGILG